MNNSDIKLHNSIVKRMKQREQNSYNSLDSVQNEYNEIIQDIQSIDNLIINYNMSIREVENQNDETYIKLGKSLGQLQEILQSQKRNFQILYDREYRNMESRRIEESNKRFSKATRKSGQETNSRKTPKVVKRSRKSSKIKRMMFGASAIALLASGNVRDTISDTVVSAYDNVVQNTKSVVNKNYLEDTVDLDKNDKVDLNTSDYLVLKAIESGDYYDSEKFLELSTVIPYLVKQYNSHDNSSLNKYKKAESMLRGNFGFVDQLSNSVLTEKMNKIYNNDHKYSYLADKDSSSDGPNKYKYFIVDETTGEKIDIMDSDINLPNEIKEISELRKGILTYEYNHVSDEYNKGRDVKNMANIIYLNRELDQKELGINEETKKIDVLSVNSHKAGYTKLSEEEKYAKISRYNNMVKEHKLYNEQLKEYESYKYDEKNVISDFVTETTEQQKEQFKKNLDEDFER